MINWTNAAIAAGALVWLIGAGITLGDLMENGLSLRDYRNKYGKDLGLFICTWFRSLSVVAWPAMGGVRFVFGLIGDSIRLVLGKNKPVVSPKVQEYGNE